MNIEKNRINPWVLDKKKLLEELANDIAFKFWLDKQKTKKLLESDISKWLKDLKNEIQSSGDETLKWLEEKKLQELFFTLKWALEVIENSSKIEIKTLKEDIEKEVDINEFKKEIEKYLPAELIKKAKDPQNIHEHILGFALWTANSIFATADILYQIGLWVLKTHYHLYMIMTGKWEIESFKNI